MVNLHIIKIIIVRSSHRKGMAQRSNVEIMLCSFTTQLKQRATLLPSKLHSIKSTHLDADVHIYQSSCFLNWGWLSSGGTQVFANGVVYISTMAGSMSQEKTRSSSPSEQSLLLRSHQDHRRGPSPLRPLSRLIITLLLSLNWCWPSSLWCGSRRGRGVKGGAARYLSSRFV